MTFLHNYSALATCDTGDLANWTPIGVGGISSNTATKKQGDAGINLFKTDTGGVVFGARREINVADMSGRIVALWLYIGDCEVLNRLQYVRVKIYDENDNWEYQETLRFLATGWNIIGLCVRHPDAKSPANPDVSRIAKIEIELATKNKEDTVDEGSIVMDYWVLGQYIWLYGEENVNFDKIWEYADSLKLPVFNKLNGKEYVLIGSIMLGRIGDPSYAVSFEDKAFVVKQIIPYWPFSSGGIVKPWGFATIKCGELADEKVKRGRLGGVFIYDFHKCNGGCFGGSGRNCVECYGTTFLSTAGMSMWIYDTNVLEGRKHRYWNISASYCPNLFFFDTDVYNWWSNENPNYCIQFRSDKPKAELVIAKGNNEVIRFGGFTYSSVVRNIKAVNCNYIVYAWGCDGGYADLINIDSNTWVICAVFAEGGAPIEIHFHYEIKFRVKQTDGLPLPNRTVKVYDRDGNLMAEAFTDESGETTLLTLEYAYIVITSSGKYDFDKYIKRFPYTIEVYKDGGLEARIGGIIPQNLFREQIVEVFVKPPVTLRVETSRKSYQLNEPVIVRFSAIRDQTRLTGLTVNAVVTKPDMTTKTIPLRDDGEYPDETANDGIYTGLFTETDKIGFYRIRVETTVFGVPSSVEDGFEVGIIEQKLDKIKEITELIRKIQANNWEIKDNQLVIYDDDGETPLLRFNLYDRLGNPAEVNVFKRERVPVE